MSGPSNVLPLTATAPPILRRPPLRQRGKKVAIIGSGPAGLAAAYSLSKKKYQVTIFEAFDKPGGVLRYGVPEFRIPKKVLDNDIEQIKNFGVQIKTHCFVGQTITIEDIFADGFAAVLIATGAGTPKFMDLPGANLAGVYYGEEFLMRVNLTRASIFSRYKIPFILGEHVAVIGSGNTALDCARAAVRLGREVSLVFRRTEEEMRVREIERILGKEEGVHFEPLIRPVEILADQDNFVGGLKCARMDYADMDATGKWDLVEVPDSVFEMHVDTVIIAVGHKPNAILTRKIPGLKLNKNGTIAVHEDNGMTSVEGVFAAGNVATNAGPLLQAMVSGKQAAEDIDHYLKK
jgi:glutamate synthase (NADPH/NADH) small chain